MKEYLFSRDLFEKAIIEVRDGEKVYPLPHIGGHSPEGMNFGYSGSGPADAANSVLCDYLELGFGLESKIYQAFKAHFIAVMPMEGGIITGDQIHEWLRMYAPGMLNKSGTLYIYQCPTCHFQLNSDMWCSLCGEHYTESTSLKVTLKL